MYCIYILYMYTLYVYIYIHIYNIVVQYNIIVFVASL